MPPDVIPDGASRAEAASGDGNSSAKNAMILYCATPVTGHLTPNLQIAQHLVSRGYDVTFLSSTENRSLVEKTGAKFIAHVGTADFTYANLLEFFPELLHTPPGVEGLAYMAEHTWVKPIADNLASVNGALTALHERDPNRKILMMCETIFNGVLPLKLGSPLPPGFTEVPKSLGIGIVPPNFSSVDYGPFGTALPFDNSPSGRARNILIADLWAKGLFKPAQVALDKALESCGATRSTRSLFGGHEEIIEPGIWDSAFVCHDTTLQMCIPSLEYPFSDWPSNIKFGGTLPIKQLDPAFDSPAWLDCLKTSQKKVVFIAQGTFAIDPTFLLIPTLKGLADRDDLIVVALLCVKGATLEGKMDRIPSNAIVIDYFPYDRILAHTDVFVTNGSYGAFQHAVANGVPLVMAGNSEDKPELAMRGERAGIAINLRTGTPSPEAVADAVGKVLSEASYKTRALELQKEAEDFDALGTVEREIAALLQDTS